jgi:hypothetical protein
VPEARQPVRKGQQAKTTRGGAHTGSHLTPKLESPLAEFHGAHHAFWEGRRTDSVALASIAHDELADSSSTLEVFATVLLRGTHSKQLGINITNAAQHVLGE